MPGPAPTLWAASLRHLLRQPAQLALAVVALAAGVATIVAVNIATASSRRALELSLRAVNGPATQLITGGPSGLDQGLYVRLFTRAPLSGNPQPAYSPVVEGYVTVRSRVLQLVGVDPFASAALEGPQGALPASVSGRATLTTLRDWLVEPGAVVLAAPTARELGAQVGEPLAVDIGGVRRTATLVGLIHGRRPGDATLMLTDIAQAQEWLGMAGRLTRIDVRMPHGPAAASALAQLRRELPPGAQLEQAAG
ncbi:MAG: ABC transporter permease, partial [Gammaproteobacteria bacterium]|nr:ABC transporter permease [Gammaproteobacteria bacterium]